MNTINKNTAVIILAFFVMSIIPFPLIADNAEIYKDLFTENNSPEIHIPLEPEIAVEMQYPASLLHDVSDSPIEVYSKTITPDTKSILTFDKIKLEIPAGAVDKEVTIEIIKLEYARGNNKTIRNVTTGAVSYRFLPDGITFNKNITISIPFNRTLLESETALSNLYTYFYNEESSDWERLPRVEIDRKNAVVVSLTNHFTDMINATLKMPESPGPVNFDINSIKNLEGANPSTGVMNLKGLTPNSTGSASFQIPLNLPPGRGSAYPDIALSYSSESPNSWMGRGFDISVPSITTDTRFGLPEYDDTDTYILAGEELILTAGEGSFPKSYNSRVEKNFSRIIRYFEGGVDYWEVTDKNGRMQTFGTEKGWIGPDRNNHSKTYTWYLTKETDANGNFVSYIYDYDSVNKYTYLKEIRYSGNNNVSSSDSGPYRVVFNTNESRPDRRMNSRGRFVSKLIRRLDSIEISFNGEVFRSYSFLYEQNEFGQTVLKEFSESDGNGNKFYAYGFDYEKLPVVVDGDGNAVGYNGFGVSPVNWADLSSSDFPGINQTKSYGVGASLYAGLKFDVYKLFKGWRTVFNIGVSGGLNISNNLTQSTLMDINGDGLADAIRKDGNTIKAYRNSGSGFLTYDEMVFSGIPELLNRSGQKGYSLGASAGLFGANGSITIQNSWMDGYTSFSDIDGDGFVDFIKSDSNMFRKNSGSSFYSTNYGSSEASITKKEPIEEDNYKRTYNLQVPLRKWKSFRSGTVEIVQSASLVNPDRVTEDGVKAVTIPGDQTIIPYSIDLSEGKTAGADTRSIDVLDGSELFFLMDEGVDSGDLMGREVEGDDLDWVVNIKYLSIKYFEGINEAAIITAEGADESFNEIIGNGHFVPVRIPGGIFAKLMDGASSAVVAGDEDNYSIIPGEKTMLLDGYRYRPEFSDYLRVDDSSDSTVRSLFGSLSYAEKEELFYYIDFTGSKVHSAGSGSMDSYSRSFSRDINPELYITMENEPFGSQNFSGEIFLDRIYNAGEINVFQTLILALNNQEYNLVRSQDGSPDQVVESSIIKTENSVAVSFTEDGIAHNYALSEKSFLLESVEEEKFDGDLLDEVTAGYSFISPDYRSLTPEQYEELKDLVVNETRDFVEEIYHRYPPVTEYDLDSDIGNLEKYRTADIIIAGGGYSALSLNQYGDILNSSEADDLSFFENAYERYPVIPDITGYELDGNIAQNDIDYLKVLKPDWNYPADFAFLTTDNYDTFYNSAAPEERLFLGRVYSRYPGIPEIEYYTIKPDLSGLEKEGLVSVLLGHGFHTLSSAEYALVHFNSNEEDQIFLDSVYTPMMPVERYDLDQTAPEEDFTRLVLLLDSLSDNPDKLIDIPCLYGNEGELGIIALSDIEYQSFSSDTGSNVHDLFIQMEDAEGNIFYAPRWNLDAGEKALLKTAERRYIRDHVEFPYYVHDPETGRYLLRDNLDDDEKDVVELVFGNLGWGVYTRYSKEFVYFQNSVLPVLYNETTSDEVGNPLPEGNYPINHNNPGTVVLPSIDENGRSILVKSYIHQYNTTNDFSPENLIVYPEDIFSRENTTGTKLALGTDTTNIPSSIEIFGGGVCGWYYGSWSSYYEFDKDLLHRTPDVAADEVERPGYFSAMTRNINSDEEINVAQVGKENILSLDTETLTGDVSSYVDSGFDNDGNPFSRTYKFAPVIKGSFLHAERAGGDTYRTIPRGSSSIPGGSIGKISAGRSSSVDVNGSVSLVGSGLSFSRNSGESWQNKQLMDMNGDRYPDLVTYTSSKDGSGSFSVTEGTGAGFGKTYTYTSSVAHLSYNRNATYGFGASPGGGLGAIIQRYSSNGKTAGTSTSAPDGESGASAGFSGLNGTAGSSFQTEAFMDITGDGLPDHIKRDGAGVYNAALNTVNSGFSSLFSFGEGIDGELYSKPGGADELENRASGLSLSNSGSYGTGGYVSFGTNSLSLSLSMGFNASARRTLSRLMDINGDGLPDLIVKNPVEDFFRVKFNLGDRFSPGETRIYKPDWNTDFADVKGLLNELLSQNGSILDSVELPSGLSVLGATNLPGSGSNPLGGIINPLTVDDTIEFSSGISINLGATLNISWLVNLGLAKFGFTLIPGINGFYAVSTTSLSMQDINGDGLPDHILKKMGVNTIKTELNSMGMAGLLNKIFLPAGGSIDLEYGREGNTVAMPQNRYVLGKVVKNDGFEEEQGMTGEHSYTETFDYRDGYYDRDERKFYGFGEVSVTRGDGSVTTTNFSNSSYYTKGLVLSVVTEDGNGQTYQEQENSYSLRTVGSYTGGVVKFPYISTETGRFYDVSDSDFIQTEKQYFYDNYGNVIRMEDRGIYSDSHDDIILNIAYSDNYDSSYLKSLPTSLTVRDSSNKLIRKREGSYDGNGNLSTLKNYYSEYSYSEYTFEYDSEYGNILSVEDPLGYRKEYTYDNSVHRYVTGIKTLNNSGGDSYTSNLSYDYRYGVETSQTDSNGNTLSKEYDSFGRLTTIISPYDTGTVKAVEYSYLTNTFPWKALTKNKISFNAADTETMDTFVITDGLNRIITTAKEGEVYNEAGNLYGWNKSGHVIYDSKGRPASEGQTVFEETGTFPTVENTALRPTIKTYDALDRILSITFPDNSVITKSYTIEGNRTIETVTDPLGNITETSKDIRGNIVGIEKKDSSGTVLTSADYEYNVLGELLKVTDAKGSDVAFTYDTLGRRLTLQSPETGLTEFEYDKADHLIRKVDANLRNNGVSINYIYDTLGRIEKIDYPFMADTLYTYGAQGDSYNRAGRIVRIEDESGSTENYYGKLGETTEVTKTIKRLTPLEDDKSASFNYTFDYQGRMEAITYPDGEIVSYEYNRGGEVEKISSDHNGLSTTYIEKIGYDEYGQRAYIKYGNGVETRYTYDENRRWLNNIETKNSFNTLQDIDYTFDRTGNILSIVNIAGRYTTTQGYEYDGLYQLTKGEGYFEDREYGYTSGTSNYTQNFTYDNTGNILSKSSSNIVNPSGGVNALNYNLEYSYYTDKPKQAEIIGDLWYLYDSNGNIIEERNGGHSPEGIQGSGTIIKSGNIVEMNRGIALTRNTEETSNVYKRTYLWDEENRLKSTIDPVHSVQYRYDSTGERTNKRSESGGETLYFNSMWLATEDSYDFRQSKNIYLGETRIATRLNMESDPSTGYEAVNTYYYHPDHLGSSNIVTTPDGEVFEHVEYTPYGETWVEKTDDFTNKIPYRFTAKELDEETGLYYYGARYLNPRTSKWISSDLAGVELINPKRQGFNIIESLNWYSYTGNNPIMFIDPNGMESADAADNWWKAINSAPDFSWPVEKGRVTSAPGSREGIKYKDKNGKTQKTKPIHNGIDIAPETPGGNETFNYIGDGEISDTGYNSVRGNYDTVDHGDGWTSSYFHEDMPSLYGKGNSVYSGNKASMGSTGASTNTHLHLELRKNGELMDPSVFLGKRPEGMLLTPGIGETSAGVLYNEKK